MIYRIYGQKDTTIYEESARTKQNAGSDEVLEITKFSSTDDISKIIGNSRILLQHDITSISESISSGEISGSTKFYLNLTSVQETEIPASYTLNAGTGNFNNNPIVTNGVSWLNRTQTELWDVAGATVFNDIRYNEVPADGIVFYEGFVSGSSGSAYLTDSINDTNGNEPFLTSSNNNLIISASEFGGTTLVFPAELISEMTYGIQFQMDPGGFTDVQFRLENPDGTIRTDGPFGQFENLTIETPTTSSFELTTSEAGQYNLRFTFFDAVGNSTIQKEANFDEVYVWLKTATILAWETFASNQGKFVLRNVVSNTNQQPPTLEVTSSKLFLYSDNVGGGDLTYNVELDSSLEYNLTTSINPQDYPAIDFTIYNPWGIKLRTGVTGLVSEFTSSATQDITFTPPETGNYTFAYTFFDSGSLGATGSIDNFKLTYSGSVSAPIISAASYTKNYGGGTWYTSSLSNTTSTQSFNKYKRPFLEESGSARYGSTQFFSSDTNTIYVPTLEVRWDDTTFDTGSLEPLSSTNITIYPKNLLSEYKEKSKARIRIVGRERFPQRTFATTSLITDIKYLPSTTYYQIRDVETDLVLAPFDTTYTKVSCDSTGNYFDFWFNTLQPERYYQFEFRVDTLGKQEYYDGYVFKVVR